MSAKDPIAEKWIRQVHELRSVPETAILNAVTEARADEREACAKIVDASRGWSVTTTYVVANKIRARCTPPQWCKHIFWWPSDSAHWFLEWPDNTTTLPGFIEDNNIQFCPLCGKERPKQ